MKLYLYVHHHLEACANVMIVNRQNKTIKKFKQKTKKTQAMVTDI
jgi:hypothetical protein